jgi:hypothetical protein
MSVLVTRFFFVVLFGMVCVYWLSLAALYLLALKRAGSAWNPDARLWVQLKVLWFGLLPLFVAAAAVGVQRWGLLVMAIPLALLPFGMRRIRRRAVEWPHQWIDHA